MYQQVQILVSFWTMIYHTSLTPARRNGKNESELLHVFNALIIASLDAFICLFLFHIMFYYL